jgi:hypothetical protein
MKTLRFEGSSDDTFGEMTTREDYDNCASGEPIIFKVFSKAADEGFYVVGQYCPGPLTGWMIGVGRHHEDDDAHMPAWPMRIEQSLGKHPTPYSPTLIIEAPDDVTVEHVEEDEGGRVRSPQ